MMLLLPAVSSGRPTLNTIHNCSALTLLKALPDESINCIVTSPPYYALRSYLSDDDPNKSNEIGLEDTPQAYIARLLAVFREARRVLRADGTCWVNLGDSYSANRTAQVPDSKHKDVGNSLGMNSAKIGLPPKSLMMIPARFTIAMQDDGWILRSEIIWDKVNPMPESVTDRPTKSHEMIYMFAKSERYFYDQDNVRHMGKNKTTEQEYANAKKVQVRRADDLQRYGLNTNNGAGVYGVRASHPKGVNLRDVWRVPSEPQSNEHYAAYPSKLVETPIKAGCPAGGVVFDPFMGSGTTALVARRLGRHYIGCDLNADYVALARKRLLETDPYQHTPLANGMKQMSLFAEN